MRTAAEEARLLIKVGGVIYDTSECKSGVLLDEKRKMKAGPAVKVREARKWKTCG